MKFKCYITTCYNQRLLVGEFETKAEADSYIRGSASAWIEDGAEAQTQERITP